MILSALNLTDPAPSGTLPSSGVQTLPIGEAQVPFAAWFAQLDSEIGKAGNTRLSTEPLLEGEVTTAMRESADQAGSSTLELMGLVEPRVDGPDGVNRPDGVDGPDVRQARPADEPEPALLNATKSVSQPPSIRVFGPAELAGASSAASMAPLNAAVGAPEMDGVQLAPLVVASAGRPRATPSALGTESAAESMIGADKKSFRPMLDNAQPSPNPPAFPTPDMPSKPVSQLGQDPTLQMAIPLAVERPTGSQAVMVNPRPDGNALAASSAPDEQSQSFAMPLKAVESSAEIPAEGPNSTETGIRAIESKEKPARLEGTGVGPAFQPTVPDQKRDALEAPAPTILARSGTDTSPAISQKPPATPKVLNFDGVEGGQESVRLNDAIRIESSARPQSPNPLPGAAVEHGFRHDAAVPVVRPEPISEVRTPRFEAVSRTERTGPPPLTPVPTTTALPQPILDLRTTAPVMDQMLVVDVSSEVVASAVDPTRADTVRSEAFAQTRAADIPRAFAAQIIDAIRQNGIGGTDITVTIEDMGRVRLSAGASESVLTVLISAERSDTLEFIRRNIDVLLQEARAHGFSDLAFNLGSDGDHHRAALHDESLHREVPQTEPVASADAPYPRALALPDGTLDLRL